MAAQPQLSELAPSTSPADRAYEYWFLARAYVAAGAYAKAIEFADAGLELAPVDAALIATRGDAKFGLHDDEGADADWQLALELSRGE
jgi:tetratricopeptide (TPR) repeat protein